LPQQIKIEKKEGEWWKNDSPASGRQESRDFLKCSCRQFFVCRLGYTKKVHMVFLAAYKVVVLVAVGLGLVDVVVAPSLHIRGRDYIIKV